MIGSNSSNSNSNSVEGEIKLTEIAIRLLDGTQVKCRFPFNAKLRQVYKYVKKKAKDLGLYKPNSIDAKYYMNEDMIMFSVAFPKQIFEPEIFDGPTLEELHLVPNATLLLQRITTKMKTLEKGTGTIYEGKMSGDALVNHDLRLKGESYEEKMKFKEKMRELEVEQIQKEREEKKKNLKKVRDLVEGDKNERLHRKWVVPNEDEQKEKKYL